MLTCLQPEISSRELNPHLRLEADGNYSSTATETPSKPKIVPGGPGSQWRMVKLRRTYEVAEEEGKAVETVARERYSSLEEFQEAIEEKRLLDEREQKRGGGGRNRERDGRGGEAAGSTSGMQKGEIRYMFNETPRSGPPSRAGSFRRPPAGGTPSTPSISNQPVPAPLDGSAPRMKTLDRLRSSTSTPQPNSQARTPIPSVFTPQTKLGGRGGSAEQGQSVLTTSELNKLQAKALRAKLMGGPDAESLQIEYEEALERAQSGGGGEPEKRVEVLPTLDGMGRLYDVGHGKEEDNDPRPGNKRKKPEKVRKYFHI